jgi:hypothetical protein
MALNSNAMVSLNDAKNELGISLADTTKDAKIERLINVSADFFESYTERKLIRPAAPYEHRWDGRNTDRILLREWPAAKPTSVRIDPGWAFAADTEIDSSLYDVEDEQILVFRQGGLARGNMNVRVTYEAGYQSPLSAGSAPRLPAQFVQATLWHVEWMMRQSSDRRLGMESKGKGAENVTFLAGLPLEIREFLDCEVRLQFAGADVAVGNFS